ncbi:hypothetical protein [Actinokineospora terrae]|uniref:Uncharacterized protein n=1 Tax=Actinokineospora terrae TaxID=155974 RepID=A0A1H9NVC9_9PSEU|nr:hypothetical protein [Actinokineospora terrae]SER39882.1 hypothetical protein SAMN04487818_103155 [Actinokineospora terrae]
MSKTVSTFAAALCAIPVALAFAVGVSSSTDLSDDEPKNPPTTTTITTEGNPWHG